jgi:hypothetical protein
MPEPDPESCRIPPSARAVSKSRREQFLSAMRISPARRTVRGGRPWSGSSRPRRSPAFAPVSAKARPAARARSQPGTDAGHRSSASSWRNTRMPPRRPGPSGAPHHLSGHTSLAWSQPPTRRRSHAGVAAQRPGPASSVWPPADAAACRTVRAENLVRALTSGLTLGRPAVMITHHVPAIRVSPDRASRRVASTVPA